MSKISEFTTVSTPALSALIPIVELPVTQGNPSVNKKISLTDLKAKLFTPATNSTYGTIKVGETLTINGSGVLDVFETIPDQTDNDGKFLTTDGSALSWATISNNSADLGDLTFSENELRNPTYASIKLATDAVGGSRRVFTFYADGALELPTSNLGVGTIQSTNGIWLNANGVMWQFNSNGAVDLPLVGGDTALIRSSSDNTINSNGKEWVFSSGGALNTPGIIVHSTIEKNNYSAVLATIEISPTYNANWNDGTYPVTWSSGGSGTVIISEGNAGFSLTTAGSVLWTIGDTVTTVNGNTLGGVNGDDDIVLTVTEIFPTSIDLTKTVNKLVEGNYFLGDGVEGQIMYLVSHPTLLEPGSVSVAVYASRHVGAASTNQILSPFYTSGVCTLLFTDGSWQLVSGGYWPT